MKGPVSILDNDLYKFSMQNAFIKLFPNDIVQYSFINRGRHQFPSGFDKELQRIVNEFAGLQLTEDEYDYLHEKIYYFDRAYIDFLKGYKFNPHEVNITQHDAELTVDIQGPIYKSILWEVPLLSIISELYYEMTKQKAKDGWSKTIRQKIEDFKRLGIVVSEFGTRRRFAYDIQKTLCELITLYGQGSFTGTSNLHFAMVNNLTPIGTQAHEWYMFHAAKYGYWMANEIGMQNWINVYKGNLGIALTDTFTTEVFLRSFNIVYAKLHDGVRADSGNPLIYADQLIEHYDMLRIDPKTKIIVFSDNIKSLSMLENIQCVCKGRIQDRYGIGTWLSNDCGCTPMNMVIKMAAVLVDDTFIPTVKLSDDTLKHTGKLDEIKRCMTTLRIGTDNG